MKILNCEYYYTLTLKHVAPTPALALPMGVLH